MFGRPADMRMARLMRGLGLYVHESIPCSAKQQENGMTSCRFGSLEPGGSLRSP